jgi:hypothetical protein
MHLASKRQIFAVKYTKSKRMKRIYLILALLGFAIPNYFVLLESLESGNYLLYRYPAQTLQAMFSNRISSIFALDLFLVVGVFFFWIYQQKEKIKSNRIILLAAITMLFGLASSFPLSLYFIEKEKA